MVGFNFKILGKAKLSSFGGVVHKDSLLRNHFTLFKFVNNFYNVEQA